MKYFNKIVPSADSDNKTWKSNVKLTCDYCKKPINKEKDYFELKAFWKIKNKADLKHFCSLRCLRKWSAEGSESDEE
ncbi:MAG: hypothetical protein QXW00_03710 [Candidatus Woesearchaeota archaeon]